MSSRTPLVLQHPQLTARSDATLLFESDTAEASPGSVSASARRAAGSRLQSMPNVLQNPSESAATADHAGNDDRYVAKLPSSTSVPQISQLQGWLSLPNVLFIQGQFSNFLTTEAINETYPRALDLVVVSEIGQDSAK